MEILRLINPIKINGEETQELSYDTNAITAEGFVDAEFRKFNATSKKGVNAAALEMDYSMQLELGFAAVLAVNPKIDYTDLQRVKGSDLIAIMRIGRNFILPSVTEDLSDGSQENKSEDE